ncbi:MAG: DUF4367 domain-containing protein [Chloroflexota bacterium]|nr:DUF4367 domain-containing protein [Chloroflexota bacterium]
MSDTPNLSAPGDAQNPENDMYFDRPLKEYARSFSYPPTPDIAAAVRERLASERVMGKRATAPARPRLAWVVVVVVVLSLAAALLTPDVQAFVRYLLRIGSVDIVLVTPTPTVFTTPGTPAPTQLPTVLENLEGRTTLLAARTRARFPLKTPSYPPDLGLPDLVYLQDPRSMIVFVWLDDQQPGKARLSLIEFVEGVGLADKMVNNPEVVEPVTVNGHDGAWVRGPHYLVFVKPGNTTEFEQHMLVEGNVLLWEEDNITYRLEADLPKEEVIKIAESLVDLPK